MQQMTMHCRPLLFVLAFYLDVTVINSHFNPFMDSEYFSIDWAGHESSKPDDVRDISRMFTFVRLFISLLSYL